MTLLKMMKSGVFYLILLGSSLFADCEMQHVVIFSVDPTNHFGEIMGASPVFSFQRGNFGSVNWSNTYSISTNEVNKKVVAFLDADMPRGTSLQVNLTPPDGARTLGTQTLSSTPVDLVIEVSKVGASGLPMVYTFTVEAEAGVISSATRVVMYTLVDG
ncbi:MAG: hypothetical protein V4489_00550 [Chlamydiota bacterium]